jgi:hypothetical protein
MAECPKLPLEAQSAIERAREHIVQHAQVTWDMLFHPIAPGSPQATFLGRPKPAGLKLQFQEYSCALLDAEAPHYAKLARDKVDLRSWLKDRSAHIATEVVAEMAIHSAAHDFHCNSSERMNAMLEGLAKRIKYWVDIKSAEASKPHAPEESISATMERSRATNAQLAAMMARAKEVLAGLDAPIQPTSDAEISDEGIEPKTGSTNDEKARRKALVAEYKSATGHPSNKKLYTARNSGIHKPEFYDWINGVLLQTSQTCINFERFLREKKPPIPRKPKP